MRILHHGSIECQQNGTYFTEGTNQRGLAWSTVEPQCYWITVRCGRSRLKEPVVQSGAIRRIQISRVVPEEQWKVHIWQWQGHLIRVARIGGFGVEKVAQY